MVLSDLVIGQAVELDKSNAQRGTTAGQGLVCTDARVDSDSGSTALSVGTFEVFDSLEDANEFFAQVTAGAGALAGEAPTADGSQGHVLSLGLVKRSDLHHITSNWRELTYALDSDGSEDPEVGKTLFLTFPVKDSAGATVSARVECEVQSHSSDGALFNLVGSYDGVAFEKDISKEQARVLLKIVPVLSLHAPSAYPVAWDTPMWGKLSYNLVKKLPLSTKCTEDFVDARDMLGVAQAFDDGETRGLATLSLVKLGTTADDAVLFATTIVMHAIALTLAKPGANTRLWPEDTAAKLGASIRMFGAGGGHGGPGPPPTQHALATALRSKCADGQFDVAVMTAFRLTLPASRWAWAESSTSAYIHTGALDAFLKKGKSASDAAAIAGLADDLSADDVHLFLSDVCSVLDGETPQRATPMDTLHPPPPPPFGQPGGSAAMVMWKEGSSKDEHENRQLAQLKIDAEYIAGSARLMAILRAFQALKDSRQDALLQGALEQCSEPAVVRLVQYNGDVAQALQGGYGPIASACTSLRDVIERRLENLVLGEGHAYMPDRQTKAFRAARLGSLRKLRLFHLIDEEDHGNDRCPLLQLEHIASLETKKYQLNKVFARLEEILRISFPSQLAPLSAFMPKFRDRIEDLVVLGLPIEGANGTSDYYRAIIDKVCSPVHGLRVGDVAGELKLKFDINWLGLERDHNDRVSKGMMQHVSSNSLKATKSTGDDGGGDKGKVKQLTEQLVKAKKQLEKRKQELRGKRHHRKQPGASDSDGEQSPDERQPKKKGKNRNKASGGGGDGSGDGFWNPVDDLSSLDWAVSDEEMEADDGGKYPKMVNAKHPLVKEWNKAHPKKDGMFKCFAFFNYEGGCPYSECRASHDA